MFTRWLNLKGSKKSVLLLGPRRAGKSTFLKVNYPNYTYATLDDLDALADSKTDPKRWVESLGKSFIIDEAQRNPDLAIAVKWAIDELNANCILTGSTGVNLLDRTIESLAGRIQIFHMPPSCFGESFGSPLDLDVIKADSALLRQGRRELKSALDFGGFPEVVDADPVDKPELLQIYKNSYFTRDVASLNHIENVEGLRAMYFALIRGLGTRYEISALSKETGLSVPTVKKYLNTLIQSGLMFKLYGYHLSEAKRYISRAKSYFTDVGILQALSEDFSRGQLIESFVVSELEKRRLLRFIKADSLYYYESAGGHEIDVIYEEPDQVTAIEIKASTTISGRDLRSLREFETKRKKTLKRIIYYMGDEFYTDSVKGVEIEVRPISSLFRWRS